MDNNIFRKSSVDRMTSPEQLTDYIRVPSPSVWAFLAAIIAILAGILIWGIFGELETNVTVAVVSEENTVYCYIRDTDLEKITGDALKIDGVEYMPTDIDLEPHPVDKDMGEYAEYMMYIGNLREGEWVYKIYFDGTLPEGVYTGKILAETVSPISFLLN